MANNLEESVWNAVSVEIFFQTSERASERARARAIPSRSAERGSVVIETAAGCDFAAFAWQKRVGRSVAGPMQLSERPRFTPANDSVNRTGSLLLSLSRS